MIYIVNGLPGAGKTTFEDKVQQIMGKCYCYKISTIDFVKELAVQCGWNGTKDAKNRKFLSELKQLLIDWNDVPFQKVAGQIKKISKEAEEAGLDIKKVAFFVDCREPEEIQKFCTRLGAKTIFIQREEVKDKELSNSSDQNVFKYNYDIIINNNGTLAELNEAAIKFIEDQDLYTIYAPSLNYAQVDINGNLIYEKPDEH